MIGPAVAVVGGNFLISSGVTKSPNIIFAGASGLIGSLLAARLKEAQRLGFTRAVVPQASLGELNGNTMEVIAVPSLRDALTRSGIADS